jgi:hypothetical protein
MKYNFNGVRINSEATGDAIYERMQIKNKKQVA